MIVRLPALIRLAALIPLAAGCARSAEKAGDSTALPSVDSTAAPPPAASAPSPAVDSGVKTPSGTTGTPAATTPTPTPTATPSETVLTGRVAVGGLAADQKTMLQVEGSGPTTLTGPLEPELRRLNSATVWVAGAPGAAAPNATFVVSRYEIVSIDGTKPVVGVLTSRDGATWIVAERDTVKLSATTPEMRAKIGAKVWIVGRRTGAEMTPQSFGVIREP